MSLEQRKITLNSISGGSPYHTGSTFLVEYSLDCVNYYTTSIDMITLQGVGSNASPFTSSLLDWNTVFLPAVGATASILIPRNSTCMRLTDLEYPTSQYIQIL
jgi:hypothetical protein